MPVDEDAARAICGWQYDPPYSVYNGNPDSLEHVLNPDNCYYSAIDEAGDLIGFFCFGADARVPGEVEQEDGGNGGILDVGLGLRPNLTGRGLGLDFLRAGLAFAGKAFFPTHFRLAVLTFNRRAIRVYEKAGFHPVRVITSETVNGKAEFLVMIR